MIKVHDQLVRDHVYPPPPPLPIPEGLNPPLPIISVRLCLDTSKVSCRSDIHNQVTVAVHSHLHDTSLYGPQFINKYNPTAPPPSRYHNNSVVPLQAIRHPFLRQKGNKPNGKLVSMSTIIRTSTARFPGPPSWVSPSIIMPPSGPPEGLA